jgi:hypothetical protein
VQDGRRGSHRHGHGHGHGIGVAFLSLLRSCIWHLQEHCQCVLEGGCQHVNEKRNTRSEADADADACDVLVHVDRKKKNKNKNKNLRYPYFFSVSLTYHLLFLQNPSSSSTSYPMTQKSVRRTT